MHKSSGLGPVTSGSTTACVSLLVQEPPRPVSIRLVEKNWKAQFQACCLYDFCFPHWLAEQIKRLEAI